MAEHASARDLGTPAVLVVGEVVALAETLLGPAIPALVAAAG
jgi:siroheme synthase